MSQKPQTQSAELKAESGARTVGEKDAELVKPEAKSKAIPENRKAESDADLETETEAKP